MHTVRLAPSHQLVGREAAIGAQENAPLGPTTANLVFNVRHFIDGTIGIHARAPQFRCQQMLPAEDVER
jgi:hypothetical protein